MLPSPSSQTVRVYPSRRTMSRDRIAASPLSVLSRLAETEQQRLSWQFFFLEPGGKIAQRVGRLTIRVQKIAAHLLVFHGIDGCHHVLAQKIGGTASDLDREFDMWLRQDRLQIGFASNQNIRDLQFNRSQAADAVVQ